MRHDKDTGLTVTDYRPFGGVRRRDLPRTAISGPLTTGEYWTDGAALLRESGRPRELEAVIEPGFAPESLFRKKFRAQQGFLLFFGTNQPCPLVLALSRRSWCLLDARYLDYAAKRFRTLGPRLWIGAGGCVLTGQGQDLAYISAMRPNPALEDAVCKILEIHPCASSVSIPACPARASVSLLKEAIGP